MTNKQAWVQIKPWHKDLATLAVELGADALILDQGDSPSAKALGRVLTVAPDGDLVPGRDVILADLKSGEDQDTVQDLDPDTWLVLRTGDWSMVPLENVLARRGRVLARVQTVEEARALLGALEAGVTGVVVDARGSADWGLIVEQVKRRAETLSLVQAEVTEIRPVGLGDRVCVDTCRLLAGPQGLLVGNAAGFTFLVHPENVANPYVNPRPFRVNAGPVHAYVRLPGGRTAYLSELQAGDEVLAVAADGRTEPVVVGRTKIERRPLILVRARAGDVEGGLLLQNAETVRLTTPPGEPVSIVGLEVGTRVVALVETGGRHGGHPIDEAIHEH